MAITDRVLYAGFWRRFAASFVDWAICSVAAWLLSLAFLPSGGGGDVGTEAHETSLLDLWWVPIVAAIPIAYFTYFLARGQSLGMKAVGIRIIGEKTGRPPGIARVLVKSFLAVVFAFSALLLVSFGFSDPPAAGYNVVDLGILYSVAALSVAGVLARLWMVWDRKKQTLPDKVVGVVVVRKVVD